MRNTPPIAVQLILHIYAVAEPIHGCPAHEEWIYNFLRDGLIHSDPSSPCGYALTGAGLGWVHRILGTLPMSKYGGKAEGFYIIGKDEPAFNTIEVARIEAMTKTENAIASAKYWGKPGNYPGYLPGAYVLKAVELLEPFAPTKPNFQTTYLS